MSLAAIVSLLQTALLLLTLSQSSPNISQQLRDTAAQVAQQAISQATAALQQGASENPSPSSSQLSKGLDVYQNSQYGFTFNYPVGNDVQTSGFASIHPFATKPVAYLYINQVRSGGKLSADAVYLTVNISSDPSDVRNCTVPGKIHDVINDPYYTNPVYVTPSDTSTAVINNVTFAISNYGAPNQAGLERNYTTVHNGQCYDIQIITIPSCSLCASGPESPSLHYAAMSAADQFVQTFKFTNVTADLGANISVSGMSKYEAKDNDQSYAFSFWYPTGWTVTQVPFTDAHVYEDATLVKQFTITPQGPVAQYVAPLYIQEVYSSTRSLTLRGANGANPVGMDFRYYFDVNSHLWMTSDLSDAPNGAARKTVAADISNNTMGGLHMFAGEARFGGNTVVPLSARIFLIVTSGNAGNMDQRPFVKTILAADPAVATPVSTAEQIATIQAEKSAYAGQ